MKKMNNKGFSLVELIIVIAIMAILAGALAPALIKYIAKSRRSSDTNNGGAIQEAMGTAFSDEAAAEKAPAPSTTPKAVPDKLASAPATEKSFWSAVDKDLSGGLQAFTKTKTTKLKNGTKVSKGSYSYCIDDNEGVTIYIKFTNGKSYQLVPDLDKEFDGK